MYPHSSVSISACLPFAFRSLPSIHFNVKNCNYRYMNFCFRSVQVYIYITRCTSTACYNVSWVRANSCTLQPIEVTHLLHTSGCIFLIPRIISIYLNSYNAQTLQLNYCLFVQRIHSRPACTKNSPYIHYTCNKCLLTPQPMYSNNSRVSNFAFRATRALTTGAILEQHVHGEPPLCSHIVH